MSPTVTAQLAPALRHVGHDGFRTAYHDVGPGSGGAGSGGTLPPVLLVHGSGPGVSALANWRGTLASPLARDHRLIAPDVPGFGSTSTDRELTHETRVRHLVGFLDALGLDRVDVVATPWAGHSHALAHRHPERVRRMVVRLLPRADLVVSRCGHWTQIERATDFVHEVVTFFSDTDLSDTEDRRTPGR